MSRHVDASLTSGTSPGGRSCRIHLLGPGAVGRAFLRQLANSRHAVVAVTDSTGTIYDRNGLAAASIADWKAAGNGISQHRDYTGIAWTDALDRVDADIVVDATPSTARNGWSASLESHVLECGRGLVLASKSALGERAASWVNERYAGRVGCNAVLGGTGHSFLRVLPALHAHCRGVAIVGSASTTSIIATIERGGSLSDGITEAARAGYLEPDPELDLRGTDAAVKVAIVASAIHRRVYDATTIRCDDIRSLDASVLRSRAAAGQTTRLIARIDADGAATVAYEAVAVDSVLAAPCGRVVYQYDVNSGERYIYIGEGLGAEATARAAWVDVQTFSRTRASARTTITAGAR